MINLSYGSGNVRGKNVSEHVCLNDTCVSDLSILLATSGIEALIVDGILGLSPVRIGHQRSELFITKAVE